MSAVHAVELYAEDWQLRLRLVCHAAEGAPCRRRPADDREAWSYDDPDLVNGDCWALDWIDAAGFEDSIIVDAEGTLARVPVHVVYDEGVNISPAVPHSLLEGFEELG